MSTITIDISETFELAYRFATETNENIFLTGKAGTGKTTFLQYLKDHTCKNIIVAAPTGVAAINAGGVTLHSLFQLPFKPYLPTAAGKNDLLATLKLNKRRQDVLRKMDLLVIDEISMVRCDVMDAIDAILRSVRRKHDLPFGGVQLLLIGDLFQLPPVAPRDQWMILQEYYNSEFFFDSAVIREQMPMLIELTKIYRQKEDSFVRLLNKVRTNSMDKDDFEDLHMRFDPLFVPPSNEKYITLTSHNLQADNINSKELNRLLSPSFVFNAEIEGEFPESMYPAGAELILKTGAQVMFLKNDPEKRFFNGKIGVVSYVDEEEVKVTCDGVEIEVLRETWENSRYTLNKSDGRLEQEVLGAFTQYPLRLAWAITIHKSQGLTFDKVMIDAGAAFSSGQVYVALSRCTSLEGIKLLSKIPSTAISCNETVVRCHQSLLPKGSLAERFEGARQVYTQQLLEQIFSFNEIIVIMEVLHNRLKEQLPKLNADAGSWFTELNNQFLKNRGVALKFLNTTDTYFRQEKIIEKNRELQNRIMAAANHFLPEFYSLEKKLTDHPLVTEHRETATVINEYLNQLFQVVFESKYYLDFCKRPFTLIEFLQHKLKYSPPKINLNIYASGKKQEIDAGMPHPELYTTLKRWRDMVCEETNLPIYMVAASKSLNEIATYLPMNARDLTKIKGFGKVKVEKYGDVILEIVQDYCARVGAESNMDTYTSGSQKKSVSDKPKTTSKIPTYQVSLDLYKSGRSLKEIAEERKFAVTTIEGHLAQAIAKGELNVSEFLSETQVNTIAGALTNYAGTSLSEIKKELPEEITFGQIRMVMAAQNAIKS